MARLKKVDMFPGFARVEQPNYEVLARCTDLAKGDRTVREFAELCGVSAATISRVINQQMNAPMADNLLIQICRNAPKDSGVTQDLMLIANGMQPIKMDTTLSQDKLNKVVENINRRASRDGSLVERICRETLQNELLIKGHSLKIVKESGIFNLQGFRYRADFVFETDAYEAVGISNWCFDVVTGLQNGFNRRLDMIFSACYLHQVSEQGKKISLVFTEEQAYNQYKKQVENLCIDDYVSLILIDPTAHSVTEEFNIRTNKQVVEIF